MKALDRWLDSLSNWHYVAVAVGVGLLAFAVAGCVEALTGGLRLRYFVTGGVLDLVVIVGLSALKRWKWK